MTTVLLGGVTGLVSDSLKAVVEEAFGKAVRSRRRRHDPAAERLREEAARHAAPGKRAARKAEKAARATPPEAVLGAPVGPVAPERIGPLVEYVRALAVLAGIPPERTELLGTALRRTLEDLNGRDGSGTATP